MRFITVFGNGRTPADHPQYAAAYELGRLIAAKGWGVVNGGYGGVMEASAKGAQEQGAKTIGITANDGHGWANPWVTEERKAESWRDRLFGLLDAGDGYVLFDGATGTMTELFVAWEMANKKLIRKPIVLLGDFVRETVERLRQNPVFVFNEWIRPARTPAEAVALLEV